MAEKFEFSEEDIQKLHENALASFGLELDENGDAVPIEDTAPDGYVTIR